MKRLTAIVLAALAFAACGDDEEATPAPKPPPTLSITQVSSAGGPVWTPESASNCVEIGTDPGGTLLVGFAKQNFELRPPGACGNLDPCGTAVLLLDQSQVSQSSTTSLSAAFSAPDAALGSGEHTFRVELRDQQGEPVLDKEQKLIADEVVLEVRAPGGCIGGADGGSDAASEGGSDAGPDGSEGGSDAALDGAAEGGDASSDAPSSDASDAAQG